MNIPNVKIGINRQPIKEYPSGSGKVIYMEDGDNFEFLLHNPSTVSVGALIYVNNQKMSNVYLIINPGQSYWLDCNPDNKRKFHFTEYSVKNTKQNQEAIADNGLIRVEFYDEKISQYQHWRNPIMSEPGWTGYFENQPDTYKYNTDYMSSTGNLMNMKDNLSNVYGEVCCNYSNDINTGRIDYAGKSNQHFETLEIDLNVYPSHTYYYKIFPKNNKVHTSDIKQYCTGCGRKRKKNENFCPSCGNKF